MKVYEANFSLLTSLIILLVLQSCSSTSVTPRKLIKDRKLTSLVLTGYGSDSYTRTSVETYLNELEALGANTASFLYTCHVSDKNDSEIDCDSFDSPRKDRLSEAIKLARERNFIVSLRVYVDLLDNQWRCYWSPKNKAETFKQLKKTLIYFSKFSEQHKLELFNLGAEYCSLTRKKYTPFWKNIISEVRKHFKGDITYGANWGKVEGVYEWKEVGFWRDLDFIGIDHYQPLPDSYKEKELVQFQKKNFFHYQRLGRSLGKPIMLTELGFTGHSKGHLEPFEWRLKGQSNELRQAMNYKATLTALKDLKEFSGVYIWRKTSETPEKMLTYQKNALGYELYHRKAWYEIQNFFSSY